MLMLTLDDAVKVAQNFLDIDKEVLRIEFEQKCWLPDKIDEPRKRLTGLIMDINPAEIASQIESDHLKNWCKTIQVEMQMVLIQM